jgi:hypothetical protein
MKNQTLYSLIAVFVILFSAVIFVKPVQAIIPALVLTSNSSQDYVTLSVNGDANASVLFFYSTNAFAYLGTTNASGFFSTTISSSTYNISTNSSVYVKIGGISGTQSNIVSWPYIQASSSSSETLSLSQTAVLLNAGQTTTITAGVSYLYLVSNTDPAIATINLNANQITVIANAYGSAVAKICVIGSSSNCANLSITVQSSGVQQLNFNQNNFSIYSGQTSNVTVSGGSGSYIISNNSNVDSVQASINGAVISLTANSTSGAASITVCTTDMNYCGILNVNSTAVNSTAITFSQTNPFVSLNQSVTITIYGGTGTNFYVSSNSNPSVVQANITGNILTLIGNVAGSSNISVCAYAGSCASLTANVGSSTGDSNSVSLSQSALSILAGQATSITIYGGSTPYNISSLNSGNIFSSNISGNILTIYGVNQGSVTASVCASVGCADLSITVGSVTSTVNPPSFSQNNILLNVEQQATVNISGNSGYYIANNSAPTLVSASVSGDSVIVTALLAGTSNITICQNGGQCSALYITVSSLVQSNNEVSAPATTEVYFSLDRYLGPGDNGDDVLQLQNALKKLGLLSATPNGYYGLATTAAIKAFQNQHGINQTGNVGPSTKLALENAKISLSTEYSTEREKQIAELQSAISVLAAKIKAITGQ